MSSASVADAERCFGRKCPCRANKIPIRTVGNRQEIVPEYKSEPKPLLFTQERKMLAVSSSTRAADKSSDLGWPEDDGLRNAALTLLQSSGYTSLRRLRCEVTDGVVFVHGNVPSYYLKQMAQTLIKRLGSVQRVTNLVEVLGTNS